jgi:hypothetical protein
LATNQTDVFVAIPRVTVRNHYWPRFLIHHWRRCRSHVHRWWRNHEWLKRYQPVWLNYTA